MCNIKFRFIRHEISFDMETQQSRSTFQRVRGEIRRNTKLYIYRDLTFIVVCGKKKKINLKIQAFTLKKRCYKLKEKDNSPIKEVNLKSLVNQNEKINLKTKTI